ncbi:Bestrophin/UPF0187 [Dimargaris cristalligena]|uniref:Bestrophin/UPF0187 n=1 Tax=Dimargaris cristalligena TaxID=215637 RepID=A0A4P9ZTN4_9FUNG|nr:Bestrophin/UPF0187 [Dimargaris cristalligena]|eukprot:RKP36946.1 Bestrophin/UPF0187 [Dimargaris cristalligena]
MYESSIPANRVPSFFETIFSYPDALRVRGSIILTILPNVLSVTLFATAVAVANDRLSSRIGLPNTLVGSFSVVLGLLLVFRSNTAHDSFKEGRRVWSQLKTAVRNITRIVWLGVPAKTPEEIQEKAQMIRYLVAYVVATKHYLRGENGIDYEDLEDLIPEEFRRHYLETLVPSSTPTHTPWILFRINRYVFRQRQANNIDPQTGNILNTTLANMHDSFTNLERILLTPIPLAYRVHLKQSLYLYCFLLPFTLIDLHYLMIPLVTAVAFMLFGIDGIGREIENPFGYDLNDLPLDRICEDLREEIEYVINTYPPGDMPASSG